MLRSQFAANAFVQSLRAAFSGNSRPRRRSAANSKGGFHPGSTEALEIRSLLSSTTVGDIQQFSILPTQTSITNRHGFLTGPQSGDAGQIADAFLRANAGAIRLTATDIDSLVVTSSHVSAKSGTTHIYMQQAVNGIPVVSANLNISISSRGEVINVGSTIMPGLAGSVPAPNPQINPVQALQAIATRFNWTFDSVPTMTAQQNNATRDVTLSASGVSMEPIPASLRYIPRTDGGVDLAWSLNIQTTDTQSWYDSAVSAVDGRVLFMTDWVSAASYRAIAMPGENPQETPQTVIVDPQNQNPTASPFGWHDTDGVAGAEFTDTRGNNVFAQEDKDNNNSDVGANRPTGGATLDFNYVFNPALGAVANENAAIVNLFYWNNIIHDVLYRYGFDEASGNFQFNNYGKGGLGGDQVQADALDGSGRNNANFATPPDGTSGRMQMYEFTFTSPTRDSDMDSFIIVHEFGHGLTNRLTGGAANAGALNAAQSRGMGEGWSDFLGLMLVQKPTDTQAGAYSTGNYVLGNPLNDPFGGIRDFPYAFDMNISPKTYGDFVLFSAPHPNGEIIAATLWDLNWIMINGLGGKIQGQGYDPDLYNGNGGNNALMSIFVEALKLQPANPTYLDFRNAVIAADTSLYGGANRAAIWTAFARRGMGFSAFDGGSANSGSVIEAFDLPPELLFALTITPTSISENAGTLVNAGTVFRPASANLTVPLVVTLSSNDNALSVPGTVTIPAGATTASFNVTLNDDSLLNGTRVVTVLASAAGFIDSCVFINVLDHELLTVSFGTNSIREDAGNNATTMTVTRLNTDIDVLNNYVTVNNELHEYDSAGVLVGAAIPVPWPPGIRPASERVRDVIVLENRSIAVYNGTTTGYLSIYNPVTTTWTHTLINGLTADGVDAGAGGIASSGQYVFLADEGFGFGPLRGIVRVDTATGIITRFSTFFSYREVTVGLDGFVYGLSSAGTTVRRFDPVTLASMGQVVLAGNTTIRALAVSATGQIYGAAAAGVVRVYSNTGALLSTTVVPGVAPDDLNDIELRVPLPGLPSKILISTSGGTIIETDTDLTAFPLYLSAAFNAFVSFGEHPSRSTRDLIVTLTNSDPSEVAFQGLGTPAQVVIPAGQASITIPIAAVDDNLRDGTQIAPVTASGAGYVSGTASISVTDVEGILIDVLATSVSEAAGPKATTVRVHRSDIDGPLDFVMEQPFAMNVARPILDRDTIISPIDVPTQISQVLDVNVRISLTHNWLGDLDVFLVSPNGTRVELFTDLVSNGRAMTDTVLDDQASSSILTGVAPYTGRFIPESPLAAMNGQNPGGRWLLEVTDDNRFDTGTLLSWELILTTGGLAPVTVTLATRVTGVDDNTEAVVPVQVTIPANQTQVIVDLDAIDDTILDGTQTVTVQATSSSFPQYDLGSDTVDVLDREELQLTVSGDLVSEAAGPGAITGRVTRLNTDLGLPLVVSLLSSDTSELAVPATVTIPAGATSVDFSIDAVDDTLFDGDQIVTITAWASGYFAPVTQIITVEDLEPSLGLTTPVNPIDESVGLITMTVTRRDQSDLSQPMTVDLSSSDTNELVPPASVIIPIGQQSVSFFVSVLDDSVLEPQKIVTITATSAGITTGQLGVTVNDHETLTVTLNRTSFLENATGAENPIGTVTRNNTDISSPLTVWLSSSDLTELMVPLSVTIPAGQSSAQFQVTAVNDSDLDGSQLVTITASATGYVSGTVVATVLDHEPPVMTGPTSVTADSRPVITWQAIPGASRYEIWVNNLSTGVGSILRNANIAGTQFIPSEPLGIGRYRVWVRAYDSLEIAGFWSVPRDFRIDTAPAISAPAANANSASSTFPRISWSAVPEAARYEIWVNNLTTGQTRVVTRTDLTTTNYQAAGVLGNGVFRAWVRAFNTQGEVGRWSVSRDFVVLSAPSIITTGGETFNRTPTISWSKVSGATHYEVWVNNISTSPATNVLRDQHITGTSYSPPRDMAYAKYAVWVRAYNGTAAGPWSQASLLSVGQPPTITTPTASATTGRRPTFIWSSIAEVGRYELWVNREVNGVNTRVILQTNLTSATYTPPADLAAGTYRVWVRAISSMGVTTAWSDSVRFTIAGVTHDSIPRVASGADDNGQQLVAVMPSTPTRDRAIDSDQSQVQNSLPTESAVPATPKRPVADRLPSVTAAIADGAENTLHDAIMQDWNAAEWWAGDQTVPTGTGSLSTAAVGLSLGIGMVAQRRTDDKRRRNPQE